MELHNLLFELLCLVWGQFKFADVVGAVQVGIVVAQLGLDRVGAQQRQRGEGAGQAPRQDVLPELQAQVVPGEKPNTVYREQRETRGPRRARLTPLTNAARCLFLTLTRIFMYG